MNSHKSLADAQTINTSIDSIAQQIISDYPESKPLFVALLRGAAPFASKLMHSIAKQSPDFHPELDYMMVSTYGSGKTAGEPKIVTDLAPTTSVDGRDVIIIDDVLDKGITANFVINHLQNLGAKHGLLAVLVNKDTSRVHDIEPDYSCLSAEDTWLVGMGMDNPDTATEAYRWRDNIIEII